MYGRSFEDPDGHIWEVDVDGRRRRCRSDGRRGRRSVSKTKTLREKMP